MENTEELNIGLGNIEPEAHTLQPAKVKIVSILTETAKEDLKKVVFVVKHPEKEETIKISTVALLVDKTLKCVGTWLNLDKEGNIQKHSALYVLLQKIGAATIAEANGKEVETELNGRYLAFKAY